MNLSGLSLDQAPPLSVPFRFFIIGPIFGLIAAALLAFSDPAILINRWHPGTLALTHAIVLGFMLSIMIGALFQVLPVIVGAALPHPTRLSTVILVPWLLGVLSLLSGFLSGHPVFFISSTLLIATALLSLTIVSVKVLLKLKSSAASRQQMLWGLMALTITLLMGGLLSLGHTSIAVLQRPAGTDLHLVWGLIGWTSLLITTIAWQVVPMFQVTPSYPRLQSRLTAPMITLGLLLWTFYEWLQWLVLFYLAAGLLSLILIAFAVSTLRIQRLRRRKIKDPHVRYWQFGCVNLLLSVSLWWLSQLPMYPQQLSMLPIIIFISGFVFSIITGMLYKIIAFLTWFHLQGMSTELIMHGKTAFNVPHMKELVPDADANRQWRFYISAYVSILAAVIFPEILPVSAGLWALYFGQLLVRISSVWRKFRTIYAKAKQSLTEQKTPQPVV